MGEANALVEEESKVVTDANGMLLFQNLVDNVLGKRPWGDDEIRKLFMSYKVFGTRWSVIAQKFEGRTENDLKNKFYTTLKRVATRAQLEDPKQYTPSFIKCKSNLLQFVDAAILYSQQLPSKRGRKKNIEKQLAMKNAIIFHAKSASCALETSSLPPQPVPSSPPRPARPPDPPVIIQQVFQQPWMMPYYMPMPGMQMAGPVGFPVQFQSNNMFRPPGGVSGGPRASQAPPTSVHYYLPYGSGYMQ